MDKSKPSKSEKFPLLSAKEVFSLLRSKIRKFYKILEADIPGGGIYMELESWVRPNEPGSGGILYDRWLLVKGKKNTHCVLIGQGVSRGRDSVRFGKIIGKVSVVSKRTREEDLAKEFKKLAGDKSEFFKNPSILQLDPQNDELLQHSVKSGKKVAGLIVKRGGETLYKKEIVKVLFERARGILEC